jgi:hypothetical protein
MRNLNTTQEKLTKRYNNFGVVIHPKNADKIDFLGKSKEEIIKTLRGLSFITPPGLSKVLKNV